MAEEEKESAIVCPWCGAVQTGLLQTAGEERDKPRAGSVGLCFDCTKPSLFQEDGTLRKPDVAEFMAMCAQASFFQSVERMLSAREAMGLPRLPEDFGAGLSVARH